MRPSEGAGGRNRLLNALAPADMALLEPYLEPVELRAGEVLFAPGDDVVHVTFPDRPAVAALVLNLREGESAEGAMIGWEGAIGGIISAGDKPAFTHGIVQVTGRGARLPVDRLDQAKQQSVALRDHFARYADCLLAQVLQTVACNSAHELDARLARWLLALQDRIGSDRLAITHEFVAQMLGVRRSYVSKILNRLEGTGAIRGGRGSITILDRARLTAQACECYETLRRHFERVLAAAPPDGG